MLHRLLHTRYRFIILWLGKSIENHGPFPVRIAFRVWKPKSFPLSISSDSLRKVSIYTFGSLTILQIVQCKHVDRAWKGCQYVLQSNYVRWRSESSNVGVDNTRVSAVVYRPWVRRVAESCQPINRQHSAHLQWRWLLFHIFLID